jgi:hypothetical protein
MPNMGDSDGWGTENIQWSLSDAPGDGSELAMYLLQTKTYATSPFSSMVEGGLKWS